jgi:uncharacterized cupredoxin-like copper-binding protein
MRFGKYGCNRNAIVWGKDLVTLPQRQFAGGRGGRNARQDEPPRLSPFDIIIIISAIAISLAALAQAQEISALASLNETKLAEFRIGSTEYKYAPAKVRVAAGRAVTLVLDNSGAETEHGLFVPALGFRLQAKAGEIARKSSVFEKPGAYEFVCDLPGHRDAGMTGTLIVVDR